jgi:cytochrome c peroxidase
MFQKAYPELPMAELGFHHAANAIAAFEIHAWAFTDSTWDLYLQGDKDALSTKAKRGALLFYYKAGCSQCHSGTLLTDQLHHNIGVPQLGPGKGASAPLDEGRALETGDPNDKFAFRTPPLRNVTLTGPWMHNGAFGTLEEAVLHHLNPVESLRDYDPKLLIPELQATCKIDEASINAVLQTLDPRVKMPLELSESEFSDLMAFLNALTSPSALDLRMDIPLSVPSGLPIDD